MKATSLTEKSKQDYKHFHGTEKCSNSIPIIKNPFYRRKLKYLAMQRIVFGSLPDTSVIAKSLMNRMKFNHQLTLKDYPRKKQD